MQSSGESLKRDRVLRLVEANLCTRYAERVIARQISGQIVCTIPHARTKNTGPTNSNLRDHKHYWRERKAAAESPRGLVTALRRFAGRTRESGLGGRTVRSFQ